MSRMVVWNRMGKIRKARFHSRPESENGPIFGGGAENRTPVRNYSAASFYMLSRCFDLTRPPPQRQGGARASVVEISQLSPTHEKPLAYESVVRSAPQASTL